MRGQNGKKKVILYICLIFCIIVLSSCCSTKSKDEYHTTDIIAGNSLAVGKLEATVAALDGTITDSRERIGNVIETSRNIANGIERIEYLFNEYELEVSRLLKEIERIRSEAEIQIETDNNSNSIPSDFYTGTPILIDTQDQVWDQDTLLVKSPIIIIS